MRKRAKAETKGSLAERQDRELVADCLKGDRTAWETLMLRYQRLIYSIPIKARLSPDDAADVFQTVCLKMLENLSKLRDHEKVSSWLITTATRESWRVSARRRSEAAPSRDEDDDFDAIKDLPDMGPLADQRGVEMERQQAVREAVDSLAERCRELLTMLFYKEDEFSYTDIAQRMRMPVSSIGPTRARCLEKLKRALEGKL